MMFNLPKLFNKCNTISLRKVVYLSSSGVNQKFDFGSVKNKNSLIQDVVAKSPKPIQPYLKLMRIDKPIGSWLLFWPCSWGIILATPLGQEPDLYTMCLFGAGSILMRGAGCTLNDILDQNFDKQVERTKSRPLANGSLTVKQATAFLATQLSLSLIILLQMNWYSVCLGASSLILVTTYPLMKRVTYWPQLMLGFTFNWGCLLGYSAVHGSINWPACLPLYFAGVFWTLIYDTIYAHQDKSDDLQLGIKSTALKFGQSTKQWLSLFSVSMSSLLIANGLICEHLWPYYLSVMIVSSQLAYQIRILNTESKENCSNLFKSNKHIGLILFLGFLFNNLLKNEKNKKKEKSS